MMPWLLIQLGDVTASGQDATADFIVRIPSDDLIVQMPADDCVLLIPVDDGSVLT